MPVYDDTAPDVSAPRSTLTGIGDYERQPGEVQKYIKGLTRRHIARVLKTHRRVLDDGDFDRGLFADIEALGKSQLTLKSIAAARRNNERGWRRKKLFIVDIVPSERRIRTGRNCWQTLYGRGGYAITDKKILKI